ncbi:MAG: NAD(P)-dependent oxidoreductase [Alphaproteobacteria bacterium]|nr:NAD(P)-dependent oxidoreductase [Alphaproteobacteria bacterium]
MLAEKIGVIGLGNAGSAVAGALAKKTTVIGFDPSLERCTHAKSLGVECVHSLEELTDRTGKIILSLPKPEISLSVTKSLSESSATPKIIIETSTVTPQTAVTCNDICEQKGIAYVDAAIAGGVASMAAGKITFFLGGSDSNKKIARNILNLIAEGIYDLGPVGAGMGTKVVNNGVMHALMVVLIEAFSMSNKLGVSSQTMIEILNREEGLLRPLIHRVQERMQEGNYAGGMSVTNARKDSVLALETAQELGVPLFATLAAHTPYEIAEAKDMGDLDYASLALLWEEWAKVSFKNSN